MPATSKSQQRLMGMVYAYKDGKLELDSLTPSLAKKVKDIADGTKKKKGISKKDAKHFATTKHKGLPEKVEESNGVSLNQAMRDNYIEEILDSTMDDKKDLERMSDDQLEERYYEVQDFLRSHPIDPRAHLEEWLPDEEENEKLITKFDKFINEASNHRGPLPVAQKINGKWEIESFEGLAEKAGDYHPFEILNAKRDPGYGYDHVVMLFVKFTKGIPKKYQTPENTYGLCIWDMDNKEFIEELGTLEDYGMTIDNFEKKTGFSIPVNEGVIRYDLEDLEESVPESKIIEAFRKHGLSCDENENFQNEIIYVDAEEIKVNFTSYALGGELPKNISKVMDEICDELGGNNWTFWDPMGSVRFFFND